MGVLIDRAFFLGDEYSHVAVPCEQPGTSSTSASFSSCQAKLDALDRRFDEKRKGRQKHMSEQTKEEKTFFDLYEPEAVCITEERFGSDQRFEAFGDGPKFVCGIDTIEKQDDCLVYSIGSDK